MSRLRYVHAFPLILAVVACGGSSPEPAKPSAPPDTSTTADAVSEAVPMCKRAFARKATCADDYLPALLDVRVELNKPPGIGDEVKTKGRDAVLAIAHSELVRDTEPAKVAALCEGMAKQLPPANVDQLLEQGRRCEATRDCKAFGVCAAAMDRGFIAAGPR